jgi:hypothetical protein
MRVMNARALARLMAASRVAIGAGFVVAPRLAMRSWIGRDADRPTNMLLTRAFGARDLVLGVGPLLSLRNRDALRPWLAAGVVADTTDLFATLAARGEIPPASRAMVVSVAGGAVALGVLVLATLEPEAPSAGTIRE